jgi:hypothetical protein
LGKEDSGTKGSLMVVAEFLNPQRSTLNQVGQHSVQSLVRHHAFQSITLPVDCVRAHVKIDEMHGVAPHLSTFSRLRSLTSDLCPLAFSMSPFAFIGIVFDSVFVLA